MCVWTLKLCDYYTVCGGVPLKVTVCDVLLSDIHGYFAVTPLMMMACEFDVHTLNMFA